MDTQNYDVLSLDPEKDATGCLPCVDSPHATREVSSSLMHASSTASETWSQICGAGERGGGRRHPVPPSKLQSSYTSLYLVGMTLVDRLRAEQKSKLLLRLYDEGESRVVTIRVTATALAGVAAQVPWCGRTLVTIACESSSSRDVHVTPEGRRRRRSIIRGLPTLVPPG